MTSDRTSASAPPESRDLPDGPETPSWVGTDARGLARVVATYPGPALSLTADGMVAMSNAAAMELLENDDAWVADLAQWLAANPVAPGLRSTPINMHRGLMVVEWASAQLDDGTVLLLGRDATLERQLRQTLTESRQRYKDLVEVSSDFAWETDETGRFVFVSPRGALGYPAEALVGHHPQELTIDEWGDLPLPFDSHRRVEDTELWLKTASGMPACVIASAVPLLGANGKWRGARGVCRDITDEVVRAAELARVRNRERLLSHIVHTLRNRIDGNEALQEAAAETARATGAEGCHIYKIGSRRAFEIAAAFGAEPPDAPTEEELEGALNGAANCDDPVSREVGTYRVLAARCELSQTTNGAVLVWRSLEEEDWQEDDVQLIGGVADRIGLAHAHIAYQERLRRLSERDGLTGLFNRRTFFERLEEMLERPDIGSSALLYVDLDNFKSVNDTLGHAQGDAVLKEIGALLTVGVRPGDLPGRLGGDEFVLWLARCDLGKATAVADRLLAGIAELRHLSAAPDKPLGLSIGIAIHDPVSGESVQQLADRADGAMYTAKRGGKGKYAVAPDHERSDRAAAEEDQP